MSSPGARVVTITGTAPDGSPLAVTIGLAWTDEEMCPAEWGTGIRACCTLAAGHPGPWHVATTDDSIIKVWPLDPEPAP